MNAISLLLPTSQLVVVFQNFATSRERQNEQQGKQTISKNYFKKALEEEAWLLDIDHFCTARPGPLLQRVHYNLLTYKYRGGTSELTQNPSPSR